MNATTHYVDGFLLVVPKDKSEEYKKMAEEGRDAWMKHGALAYFECRGEDLAVKDMGEDMRTRSFYEMSGAKEEGEEVWFSFITFKSKAHRDEVNAKVFEEMEAQFAENQNFVMPFDMKRMATGGFEVLVSGE